MRSPSPDAARTTHRGPGRAAFGAVTAAVLAAWAVATQRSAVAQNFFRVSPGPLSTPHAQWDHSDGCTKCHEIGGGVTRPLCLDCHDHAELKQAVATGRGLHSRMSQPCTSCHTEHRGRQAPIVDWSQLGGREPFDHDRTGFALQAKHAEIACTACHVRRLRSGDTSFVGLSQRCASCHDSPHGKALSDRPCLQCHSPARPWKSNAFDHDTTGFVLRGKHGTANCSDCHREPGAKPSPACASCHKRPHGERFAQHGCADCHRQEAPSTVTFAHAERTGFALDGSHAGLSCRACHRGKGPQQFERLGSAKCADCHAHRRAHGGDSAVKNCRSCHAPGAKADTRDFNHQRQTRFPLVGFHLSAANEGRCAACHPGGKFHTDKRRCQDCHQDPHGGALGKQCERCHSPKVSFKRFRARPATYFDHNKQTQFPLAGKHTKVACRQCHPQRRYKTGQTQCVDCHRDSNPHQGRLGEACARCHTSGGGATGFVHESMTAFPRTGAHLAVACGFCHREPGKQPPPRGWTREQQPPPVDLRFPVLGKTCADCHADPHDGAYGLQCESCHNTNSFVDVQKAAHELGAFRLSGEHDRLSCHRCHREGAELSGTGELCLSCHAKDDVHNNSLSPLCGECHSQEDWRPTRFNHAQVGFALRGVHRLAPCEKCHGVGVYQGLDPACETCHAADAAWVSDPVHTAELQDCEACHTENSFVPARHHHPAFPLRGAHRSLGCISCHRAGIYAGTPSACVDCHAADFANPAQTPNHTAAGFSTYCEDCHLQTSWTPATYQHQSFVLRGVHRALPCTDCHTGADYTSAFSGLVSSWDCGACHGPGAPVDAWPASHDVRGYPITCELCHREAGFLPARSPP